MIRATTATWLNYATTLVFQILFAANFGSSGMAGAFVIAFAVAVSLGGLFVTTTLTNVLPRLVDKEGALSRPALRVLLILAGLIMITAFALGLASSSLAAIVAPLIGVTSGLMGFLFVIAAVFLATLGLSGVLGSIALIRGRRFLPAIAPALPSTLGALYLVGAGAPTVPATFGAIALGGVFQVLLIAVAALWPRPRVTAGGQLNVGRLATLTALLLLLMGLLPPLQRIVAAAGDPTGAAQFDYAARGMLVAQQILIGGLLIAVLPDWTTRHRQAMDIRPDVIAVSVLSTLLLFAAGSVALVAAHPVVELIYERGAFSGNDTDSVVLLTRILVPGFVAEGLLAIITQAFLASGRTDAVLRVWAIRTATLLVFTIGFGLRWGAVGVAAAYSLSMLATGGAAAIASANLGTLRGGSRLLLRSFQAGLVTATVAVVLMLAGDAVSPWLAALAVVLVALVGAFVFQLSGTVVATLKGGSHRVRDSYPEDA